MSQIILCDTRQKKEKNEYIDNQLVNMGFTVNRCKLYVGDYTYADNQQICVDTKQNIQEIVGNVIQQHDRFAAECERAKEAGIKLYVLVKDERISDISQVFTWYNPRLKISPKATTGRTLAKILYSMREKYGVQFCFSNKKNMGETIVRLLNGEELCNTPTHR